VVLGYSQSHNNSELDSNTQVELSNTKHLKIDIVNDGKMPKSVTQGNGLSGIIERLEALKGKAAFMVEAGKFHTQLLIPVA
jgi:signal transduction histidine kinase